MKQTKLLFIIMLIFSITACTQKQNTHPEKEQQSLYRETNTPSRFGKDSSQIQGKESSFGGGQNEIGFFKYNPKDYEGNSLGSTLIIDRPLLAKHISHLVSLLPSIQETTTLVTDDHIFIGIKQGEHKKKQQTIKEAKRTAESITPRYFKIHVISNERLEARINQIGIRMRGNYDVEGIKGDLEKLLQDLGDKNPPNVNDSIQPNKRSDVNPTEK